MLRCCRRMLRSCWSALVDTRGARTPLSVERVAQTALPAPSRRGRMRQRRSRGPGSKRGARRLTQRRPTHAFGLRDVASRSRAPVLLPSTSAAAGPREAPPARRTRLLRSNKRQAGRRGGGARLCPCPARRRAEAMPGRSTRCSGRRTTWCGRSAGARDLRTRRHPARLAAKRCAAALSRSASARRLPGRLVAAGAPRRAWGASSAQGLRKSGVEKLRGALTAAAALQVARPAPAGDAAAAREAALQPQLTPDAAVDTPPIGAAERRGSGESDALPPRPTACQVPGCANADGMRGAYNKRVRCAPRPTRARVPAGRIRARLSDDAAFGAGSAVTTCAH